MGIFTSFATGFLQGSVDAAREKKAAQIEADKLAQERRDSLGGIVFDLIKDNKLTGAEGAALLGQKDLTRADIAAAVNIVADADNSTRLGKIILPFSIGYGKDEDVFQAVSDMEDYLIQNGDNVRALIQSDENTRRAFTGAISSLYNQNNLFYHKKFSVTDDSGKYVTHAYRDYSKGLQNFEIFAKELGVIEKSNFATIPMSAGDMQLNENEVFIPQSYQDGKVEGFILNSDDMAEYRMNPESLGSLASLHGMPQGGNQVFANGDYMTYGEDAGMTAKQLYNDDDKMRSIGYGSRLAAASAQDVLLLEGGASTTVMNETSLILTEAGRGSAENGYADEDVGAMRRAAFTITKPEARFASAPPSLQTGVNGVTYAKAQGYDVTGFREQASATDEAVLMLEELERLQTQYGATGLVAKVEAFALGVVGQAQQISDVFLGNEPANDLFTQNLDPDTDANELLATAMESLGYTRMQQISKMDALRLTLAAKMARAVDPSGRLSNQDFEIQLSRLGGTGWFTTQEGSLTRLATVKDEFINRQKEQKVLTSIINKSEITVEDRRFIRATHLVTQAINHRRKGMLRQQIANEPGNIVTKSTLDKAVDIATGTGQGKPSLDLENDYIDLTDGTFVRKPDTDINLPLYVDGNSNDITDRILK